MNCSLLRYSRHVFSTLGRPHLSRTRGWQSLLHAPTTPGMRAHYHAPDRGYPPAKDHTSNMRLSTAAGMPGCATNLPIQDFTEKARVSSTVQSNSRVITRGSGYPAGAVGIHLPGGTMRGLLHLSSRAAAELTNQRAPHNVKLWQRMADTTSGSRSSR